MVIEKAFAGSKNCYSTSVAELRITNTHFKMKYLTISSLFTIQESEFRVAPERLSASLMWQEASRAPVGFNMNSRNENY